MMLMMIQVLMMMIVQVFLSFLNDWGCESILILWSSAFPVLSIKSYARNISFNRGVGAAVLQAYVAVLGGAGIHLRSIFSFLISVCTTLCRVRKP